VIDYLKSPDQSLVLDASGYLQHLTYNNDTIKEETRNYGQRLGKEGKVIY
jgi:hypothetical protein